MNSLILRAVAILSLGIVASPAFSAGDPAEGYKLAKEHCSDCHDVEAGGAFKQYPPSFAAIAVYRSEAHIRALSVYPALHSAMPKVLMHLLADDNLENLVAYIMSLEK